MFGQGISNISVKQMLWRGKVAKGSFAFLSGGVAAFIFPPFVSNVFGYVALIFFLAMLFEPNRSKKSLFWLAYAFGFSFYGVSFAWICNALLIDGQKFLAFVPAVFLAIGAFFALFWALPALALSWGKNIYAKALFFCCVFVVFEWVRSFIFTGFPWNLLGTALSFDARLIQGAAYVGAYGLSLLLLLMLSGAAIWVRQIFSCRFDSKALIFIFVPLLVLVGFVLGYQPLQKGDFRVRLVQPSIPQTFKWNKQMAEDNFHQYINLSKSKPLDNVRLVVWGETASPFYLDRDTVHLREITEAIPENGFLITGLLRVGMENGQIVPFNSMFVIDKQGYIRDYYDKSHLVPFGEYLPLRDYLPRFMEPVANVVGDLGRGEKFKNIQVPELPLMGGAVCYEVIFPKGVVNPLQKPELLIVVANDGWYGISAGPYQHLAAAQMRAVEEGITVVRSANTGISAVIAPNGEVYGRIELNKVGISDVELPQKLSHSTLYNRYGNLLPLFMIILCILLGVAISKHSSKDKE